MHLVQSYSYVSVNVSLKASLLALLVFHLSVNFIKQSEPKILRLVILTQVFLHSLTCKKLCVTRGGVSVIWDAVSIIAVCVCVKIGQISRGTGLKPPGIGLGYLPNVRSVKIQRGVKNSGQKYQEQGELEGRRNRL